MVHGTDLGPGHWFAAILGICLIGSLLVRNWMRASRSAAVSRFRQTVWVCVEQVVALVAWWGTGWALHGAPPSVLMASEMTAVGWHLRRGVVHFCVAATLTSIPLLFWVETIHGGAEWVLVLPGLVLLYTLTYATELMREEHEAASRSLSK